jgi:hypothetical protein
MPSKIFPIYNPTIPKTETITPEKKQMDVIKLAYPSTLILPLRYLIAITPVKTKAIKEIETPNPTISLKGLSL